MKNNNVPLVSVLLPVYNAESTIFKCLKSIVNQDYNNLEIIVIDDGSNDNSLSIIKKFADNDKRFLVISRPNKGLIKTLNEGLAIAKGEFIVREDADDFSSCKRISQQLKYMLINKDVMVLGTANKLFGADSKIIKYSQIPEELKAKIIFSPPVAHPSVMLRTSFLIKHKLIYDEKYEHCEDYALWSKILDKGGEISNLKNVLHYYHIHENQISVVNSKRTILNHYKISSFWLDKLGIHLTEKQIELLICIDNNKIKEIINLQIFNEMIKLHEKLNESNAISNFFNIDYLKRNSSERLTKLCISHLGNNGLRLLSKSYLFEYSIYSYIKLKFFLYYRDMKNFFNKKKFS